MIQTLEASGDPADLTAASGPGVGEVTLTWTPAANASAHWVWSVRPDGQESRWHEAEVVGSTVIRDLEPGQEYWFIVIAVRSAPAVGPPSWSGFSDWVKSVALAPPPPPELDAAGGLTAAPGPNPGEVSLRWTPGAGADVHWIWSVRSDGTESRLHQAYDGDGSITIDGLEIGVEYAFAVISAYAQPEGLPVRWSNFSNWATAMPLPAPPPSVTVADAANRIAAGGKHTCMLQDDVTAMCWGANGDADKGQADPPAGVIFTVIAAGYEHTCGITDAGDARCWGDDDSGQSTAPSGTFTAIDAGRAHTCALRADNGTAQCWGSNEYGQLDAPSGASFTAITAGGEHSCGLHEDGRVECWGDNYYQQSTPPDALFYAVSAGTWHTCGIKRDGSIACWGANPDGQAPAEMEGSYQAVSAGGWHTCALQTDGWSVCWGRYHLDDENITAISAGYEHACWIAR